MGMGMFLVSITKCISTMWLSSRSDVNEGPIGMSVVPYVGLNGNSYD